MDSRRSGHSIITDLFDAVNAGQREDVLALVHPSGTWSPTAWSGPATRRGREGVAAWLDQFGPGLMHIRIEVDEIIDAEPWVLALGTVLDTRDGLAFSTQVGWGFEVREGLVVAGRAYGTWNEARQALNAGCFRRP